MSHALVRALGTFLTVAVFHVSGFCAESSQTIQGRLKICSNCSGDLALVGHPTLPFRLALLASHHQRRSIDLYVSLDGIATDAWTRMLVDPTNDAALWPSSYQGRAVVLNDDTLFLTTLATLPTTPLASSPKLGAAFYVGSLSPGIVSRAIERRATFQAIPPGDANERGFQFITAPVLAVDPTSPSTIYIGGNRAWFEQTQDSGMALYASRDRGNTFTRTRLVTAGDQRISSLVVGADGTLYAVTVRQQTSQGETASLLRFRSVESVSFDALRLPAVVSDVPARTSMTSPRTWDAATDPILLADTAPMSRHRGRLYLVWAQATAVTPDANVEGGRYGSNFDVFVSFSDDRGQTWSTPVRVNDDTGSGDQGVASAQLDTEGRLHVAFLDHRDRQDREVVDTYYTSSTSTNTLQFSKNLRVNEEPISLVSGTFGESLHVVMPYPDRAYVAHLCGSRSHDVCVADIRGIAVSPPPSVTPPLVAEPTPRAPVILTPAETDLTIRAGERFIFTPTADLSNGPVALSVSRLPEGATFMFDPIRLTGPFTWTPRPDQVSSEPYRVQIIATHQRNLNLITTKTISITVVQPAPLPPSQPLPPASESKPSNHPPKLPPVLPEKSVQEGRLLEFLVEASDEDGDELTYGSVGTLPPGTIPPGATLDSKTGRFQWIPTTAQVGAHHVLITVSDGKAGVFAPLTITVLAAVPKSNHPPVLSPIPDKRVKEGELLEFIVQASDEDPEDRDQLIYGSRDRLPQGATLDSKTGRFRWTPTFEQAGTSHLTMTVTDAASASASQPVTITVEDVNRAPLVESLTWTPASPITQHPVFFQAHATDLDPDDQHPLTYVWDFGDGATEKGATAAHTYTIPNTYTVTLTVRDRNATTKSVSVTVSRENTPPAVSLISPKPDERPSAPASITLRAEASDKDGTVERVEFFHGDTKLGEAKSAPFLVQWTATTARSYTLTAKATDNMGATTVSDPVTITVKNASGQPVITSPEESSSRVKVGETFTFTPAADQRDGRVALSVWPLPPGATFDFDPVALTGTFRWTPQAEHVQARPYSVQIIATHQQTGSISTKAISISVVANAPVTKQSRLIRRNR